MCICNDVVETFYELIWWKTRIKIKQTLHKDKTRVSENEQSQIYVIIAIFYKFFPSSIHQNTYFNCEKIKLHITHSVRWNEAISLFHSFIINGYEPKLWAHFISHHWIDACYVNLRTVASNKLNQK